MISEFRQKTVSLEYTVRNLLLIAVAIPIKTVNKTRDVQYTRLKIKKKKYYFDWKYQPTTGKQNLKRIDFTCIYITRAKDRQINNKLK